MRIPNHCGVKGNIIAADLAGLRTRMAQVGHEPRVGFCESPVKPKLRDWTAEAQIWDEKKRGDAGRVKRSSTPQTQKLRESVS